MTQRRTATAHCNLHTKLSTVSTVSAPGQSATIGSRDDYRATITVLPRNPDGAATACAARLSGIG